MFKFIKKFLKKQVLDEAHMADLIELSAKDVSTSMISKYISYLWIYKGIRHLGYIFTNNNGVSRYTIYQYHHATRDAMFYFNDRCPAMIEEEINEVWNNAIYSNLEWTSTSYNGGIPIIIPANVDVSKYNEE